MKHASFCRFFVALFMGFLLSLASVASAANTLSYQGRVASGGVVFSGTGQFQFALVSSDGLTTYWKNDGTTTPADPIASVSLTVSKGLFSVKLGDTAVPNMAAIDPATLPSSGVCLRIWFNDGTKGFQRFSPDASVADTALSNFITAGSSSKAAIFLFPKWKLPLSPDKYVGSTGSLNSAMETTYELPQYLKTLTFINATMRTDWEGSYSQNYGVLYLRIRKTKGGVTTVLFETSTLGSEGQDVVVSSALNIPLDHDSYIYDVDVFLQRYEGAGPGFGNWTGSGTVKQISLTGTK